MPAMLRLNQEHVALIAPAGHLYVYTIGGNGRRQIEIPSCTASIKDSGTDESLASGFSRCGCYFALCDDHKRLVVWDVTNDWSLISLRALPRRATALTFAPSPVGILPLVLVADKSGDVVEFDLNLTGESIVPVVESAVPAGEKEGDAEGTGTEKTVLGHVSMLLDLTFNADYTLLVTCDRDEKIRVSHYPHSYIIQSFCLAHNDFVSRLFYLDPEDLLLSASGDGTVRLWNYRAGSQLDSVNCAQHLYEPSDLTPGSALLPRVLCSNSVAEDGAKNSCQGADVRSMAVSGHLESEMCTSGELSVSSGERIIAVAFNRVAAVLLILLHETSEGLRMKYLSVHMVQGDVIDVIFTSDNKHLIVLTVTGLSVYSLQLNSAKDRTLSVSPVNDSSTDKALYDLMTSVNSDSAFFEACQSGNIGDVSKLHKVHIDNLTEYITRKQQRIQEHHAQKPAQEKSGAQKPSEVAALNHQERRNKKWKERKRNKVRDSHCETGMGSVDGMESVNETGSVDVMGSTKDMGNLDWTLTEEQLSDAKRLKCD